MLIDDEQNLIEMVKIKLQFYDEFDVTTVYCGREGVKQAKTSNFDLVITDYNMPDMNGEEVLDALKEMNPDLPVLMFSVHHDDDSTMTSAIRDKVDGVVAKPIDFEVLNATIKNLLAG